jgi:hypothetical protein
MQSGEKGKRVCVFTLENLPNDFLISFIRRYDCYHHSRGDPDMNRDDTPEKSVWIYWSGREDLNLRPPAPKAYQLRLTI